MIDFLTNHVVWWHWVIFGLVLILLELLDGSFLMLGLGSSAILEGIIIYFFKIKFPIQLLSWAILAVIYILFWKKFLIDTLKGAKVGQSDSYIGTIGIVTSEIKEFKKGRVKFEMPVLGSDEWIAIADYEIPAEKKVKLTEIRGQYAKVDLIDKD